MSTEDLTARPQDELTADVVVIGGGPVGENIAQYAIEGTALSAVIIEGELMGGECSYFACMPSKALLRPLAVASAADHLEGVGSPGIDREGLLARRDEWVSHYDDAGQVEWATGAGIEVRRGHGRVVGEREVLVEGERPTLVRARRAVVLATGSAPAVPEQFAGAAPWGSRDATGVREVPGSLLIVGGGVVAVEAATWMAALGARVRMLVRGSSLISSAEPFAGEHIGAALREAGVEVELDTEVVSCERVDAEDTGLGKVHGGRVTVQVRGPEGERAVSADEVLVATGRRPRLDDVGLDRIGLEAADVSAARLPTWLHAVGDASGEPPLTHWGKYRARVLGGRLRAAALDEEPEPVPDTVPVPQVIFTDPQVASVGVTERQAREAGHELAVARVPFGGAAGTALLRDDVTGTAQIVVDAESGLLLGATLVGHEAGELLHPATIAIVGQVPVSVLRHAVPSFPAASELWLRLLEELPRELRR